MTVRLIKTRKTTLKGFTLIELLIVVGILAVISSIIVLLINPTQFIAQGRDSRRLSDLKIITNSINLAKTQNGLVDSTVDNIVYISLPDTNGNVNDNCILDYPSLPTLSGVWQYRCQANAANLRRVDSSGWLPIDFTSVSNKPINVLPIDPANNSNYFYSYTRSSLATVLESDKYITQTASNDGGTQPNYYETSPITYIGSSGSAPAIFAGTDDSILKCLTSTGCDDQADWVDVTGASWPATVGLTYDSINKVIYAATWGSAVYRCDLTTDCDARTDWVSVFDPGAGSIFISSIYFDPVTSAIYAGTESSNVWRCPVSTGCTVPGNWSLVLTGVYDYIVDIKTDTINNVIYAADHSDFGADSRIYRCLTATLCDASADWTFVSLATQTSIQALTFDSANGVMYAPGWDFTGGELRRCAVSTGCDVVGEWTTPYAIASTNFVSSIIVNANLFIGEFDNISPIEPNTKSDIHRCLLSSACDQQTDFAATYRLPAPRNNYTYAFTYDSANGVMYAGNGEDVGIARCLISSSCDAAGDWTNIYTGPDWYIASMLYKP